MSAAFNVTIILVWSMPWQKRPIAPFYHCKPNPNQRDKYDPISHWHLGRRYLPPTSLNIRGPYTTSSKTTHVLAHRFKQQNYILGKTEVTLILFCKSFFFCSWTTLISHGISLFRKNLPSLNISHILDNSFMLQCPLAQVLHQQQNCSCERL